MPTGEAAIAMLRALPLGTRVVVRRREDDGFHDALGDLSAVDETSCTVDTRRGPVTVPFAKLTRAKPVPPPPPAPPPRYRGL